MLDSIQRTQYTSASRVIFKPEVKANDPHQGERRMLHLAASTAIEGAIQTGMPVENAVALGGMYGLATVSFDTAGPNTKGSVRGVASVLQEAKGKSWFIPRRLAAITAPSVQMTAFLAGHPDIARVYYANGAGQQAESGLPIQNDVGLVHIEDESVQAIAQLTRDFVSVDQLVRDLASVPGVWAR